MFILYFKLLFFPCQCTRNWSRLSARKRQITEAVSCVAFNPAIPWARRWPTRSKATTTPNRRIRIASAGSSSVPHFRVRQQDKLDVLPISRQIVLIFLGITHMQLIYHLKCLMAAVPPVQTYFTKHIMSGKILLQAFLETCGTGA